jgi:hypothetical protein
MLQENVETRAAGLHGLGRRTRGLRAAEPPATRLPHALGVTRPGEPNALQARNSCAA